MIGAEELFAVEFADMKRLSLLAIGLCVVLGSLCTVVIIAAQQSSPVLEPAQDLKLTPCDNTICFAGIEVGKTTWAEALPKLRLLTNIQSIDPGNGVLVSTRLTDLDVTVWVNSSNIVKGIELNLRRRTILVGPLISIFGPPSCGVGYNPTSEDNGNGVGLFYRNGLSAHIDFLKPVADLSTTRKHFDAQSPIDTVLIVALSPCSVREPPAVVAMPYPPTVMVFNLVPWQGFTLSMRHYPTDLQSLP